MPEKVKQSKDDFSRWQQLIFKLERISFSQKIFLIDNLRVMIRAGLSIVEALKILEAQVSGAKLKRLISGVTRSVEKGQTLAATLEKVPELFPSIYVKMIEAGEISGKLEESMAEVVVQMKKTYAMNSKIRGAMVYPAVILLAVVGIGIEMVVFVLPKILVMFTEMNVPLPWPTRLLIVASNFLVNYGLLVLIGVAALAFGFWRLKKLPRVKSFLDLTLLKTPIFGKISRQVNLARFSLTLSSLLKSAIPIIDAINITADVLGNSHFQNALRVAGQEIKSGRPLSQILARYSKLFPPLVTQMIMVGEQSGATESLLNDLSNYYGEEVDEMLKNISTIIEPVIIVFLGVVVGGLAIAVIMPMYSLAQAV